MDVQRRRARRPYGELVRTTLVAGAGVVGAGLYVGAATGRLSLDTGWGRQRSPLGPQRVDIDAPPNVVFDVIADPYLGTTPRAMSDKVRVLERGIDMVLAEHRTPVGWGLTTLTVETVRFERPKRVDFRLVQGPVPEVVESFVLYSRRDATTLEYSGHIAADMWALGAWWIRIVRPRWEATVAASLSSIRTEAERRRSA